LTPFESALSAPLPFSALFCIIWPPTRRSYFVSHSVANIIYRQCIKYTPIHPICFFSRNCTSYRKHYVARSISFILHSISLFFVPSISMLHQAAN
uniref:Uncharacterized protein n=1 Tax=Pristionchus pacificus TaxID=54126 RepID=A0A2A6CHU8_PRIPA